MNVDPAKTTVDGPVVTGSGAASPTPGDDVALDERLSQYLDGELDAEERRRIEHALKTDERVTARFARLQRTWDSLDKLPRAEVSANFTRSTVEMAAVKLNDELNDRKQSEPRRRRRLVQLVAVACLLAIAAGFVLVRAVRPSPNRNLIRAMPVVEDLHRYKDSDDAALVRALADEKLFPEPEAAP
jgi:anti-sigma-K factor RskA